MKKRLLGFVAIVSTILGLGVISPPAASASIGCTPDRPDGWTYYNAICANGDEVAHTASLQGRMIFKAGGSTHLDTKQNIRACTVYMQLHSDRNLYGTQVFTQDCTNQAKFGGLVNFVRTYYCSGREGIQVSQYAWLTDGYGSYGVAWTGWTNTAYC